MTDYIPKLATIEQSCEWLRARLGGVWILPRLLECHLKPYFWIDYKPGHPQIFGGKVEGYLTWMIFANDVYRLEVDGTNALVNMFTAHDGTLVKIEPGWTVPLSELRFKREALERVASILEGEVSRQPTEKQPITGVDRNRIIAAFPAAAFPAPKRMTADNWSKTLSDPPKWLEEARVNKGKPSVSALWNPAKFAMALGEKKYMTVQNLTAVMRREFADWLPEWEKYTASFD